jgi:hypothetical protein
MIVIIFSSFSADHNICDTRGLLLLQHARTCVSIITYLIQDIPIARIFDTLFGKENKCMCSVMLIQRHGVPSWYPADVIYEKRKNNVRQTLAHIHLLYLECVCRKEVHLQPIQLEVFCNSIIFWCARFF